MHARTCTGSHVTAHVQSTCNAGQDTMQTNLTNVVCWGQKGASSLTPTAYFRHENCAEANRTEACHLLILGDGCLSVTFFPCISKLSNRNLQGCRNKPTGSVCTRPVKTGDANFLPHILNRTEIGVPLRESKPAREFSRMLQLHVY